MEIYRVVFQYVWSHVHHLQELLARMLPMNVWQNAQITNMEIKQEIEVVYLYALELMGSSGLPKSPSNYV